ncbi:IS911 transposase orfB [Enterobacter hormaechei]|nr:IS911 transposase orfB [Enterobacter hormaechei]SAE07884.1 IS911 transposase orfB [Enterobacter hormaechei]VAG11425.1 IS911 transposase orfB [Enterobacter hormaechei]
MVTLCQVFGVHRSSYKYWVKSPEKPDGKRAILRSQVLELHNISHGSAGARSIAIMATLRGFRMGRWLAGNWDWLVVSNPPTGINVVAMNTLLSQTTLSDSSQ